MATENTDQKLSELDPAGPLTGAESLYMVQGGVSVQVSLASIAAYISGGTEAPTEPPTEAPTEVPTEAPTEAPTEPPTEAPTEPPAGNLFAESDGGTKVGFVSGIPDLSPEDFGDVVNPIDGYTVRGFLKDGGILQVAIDASTDHPASLQVTVDGGDPIVVGYLTTTGGADVFYSFSELTLEDSTWYTVTVAEVTEEPSEATEEPSEATEAPSTPNLTAAGDPESVDSYVGYSSGMSSIGVSDRGDIVNPVNGYIVRIFVDTGFGVYCGLDTSSFDTDPPSSIGVDLDGAGAQIFALSMEQAGAYIYLGVAPKTMVPNGEYLLEIGEPPAPDVTEIEECVSMTFTAGIHTYYTGLGTTATPSLIGTIDSQLPTPARPIEDMFSQTRDVFTSDIIGYAATIGLPIYEADAYAGYSIHVPQLGLVLPLDEAERSNNGTNTLYEWSHPDPTLFENETQYTVWLCPPGHEPPTEAPTE